jgi:uncharacterized protein
MTQEPVCRAARMTAMEIVERLRRVLDGRPGVRLAALFGSTATRRRHAWSDVDVGVLLDPDVDLPALGVELERATGARVDLIPLDNAPSLLRFEIARDGVLLVARDAHEWPEFRARAMIDWWDWAPTARMMHRVMAERLREEARRGPA